MGKFEQQIPHFIDLVNKEIRDLEYEDRELYHDCDCKFCEYDDIPDDDWPRHEEIGKTIKDREKLIVLLKRHAKLHGIEINEKVAA